MWKKCKTYTTGFNGVVFVPTDTTNPNIVDRTLSNENTYIVDHTKPRPCITGSAIGHYRDTCSCNPVNGGNGKCTCCLSLPYIGKRKENKC